MEPIVANADKKNVPATAPTLGEIKSSVSEDVRLAMEAMERVMRLRRCSPPRRLPEERYYRIA